MEDIVEAMFQALNGPGAAGAAGIVMAFLFLRHAGVKDKLSTELIEFIIEKFTSKKTD